jgi:hypothetical protein
MNKLLLKTIFLVFLFSCSQDESSPLEEFVTGAKIAGVNGIHFGPDGCFMQHLLLVLIFL